MAKDRMDVLELLRKEATDADLDFLREGLRVLIQAVMEAEVATKTGASFGERSSERITYRNGYRARPWDTRVGILELQVPKVREGSYFPSLLEPRRRSERALLAVVQQAYVEGGLKIKGLRDSKVPPVITKSHATRRLHPRPCDGRIGGAPSLVMSEGAQEASNGMWSCSSAAASLTEART